MSDMISAGIRHLLQNDAVLSRVIEQSPVCSLTPSENYYESLLRAIVSQQLSMKAASTIWERFLVAFEFQTTPENILAADITDLRAIGLSRPKASYMQDLARNIRSGALNFDRIEAKSDAEIIEMLTAVKGIGVWSAQMFLMFTLCRPNVLPTGDLGIRKAAMSLYRLPTLPLPEELEELSEKNAWKPYQTIASWYLWRSLEISG